MMWKLPAILILTFGSPAIAAEIFATGFESGSLQGANGFHWGVGVRTEVSSDNAKEGTYSLKFRFEGKPSGGDAFSEQRFHLGDHYPDLWVKYDLYIPPNYSHRSDNPSNNKGYVMLWAGDYANHLMEGPKLGSHFWSMHWAVPAGQSQVAAIAISYVNGSQTLNKNWLCQTCGEGKHNGAINDGDLGQWMTIVVHAKYATVANSDGVYEIWKTDWQGNTVKMVDIQDGPWYATQVNSTLPARGFDKGYLLGWANSGFDEDTFIYIDNVVFSSSPLPVGGMPPVAAPNAPAIVEATTRPNGESE